MDIVTLTRLLVEITRSLNVLIVRKRDRGRGERRFFANPNTERDKKKNIQAEPIGARWENWTGGLMRALPPCAIHERMRF